MYYNKKFIKTLYKFHNLEVKKFLNMELLLFLQAKH